MAAAAAAKRKYRQTAQSAAYGNAAYDLVRTGYGQAGAGAAERPRPLVKPKEEVRARPRVHTREAGKVSLFAVAGFLTIGIFCMLAVIGNVELLRTSSEITALKSELTALESREKLLRTRYELAFDLASIEQSVTSDGSMVKPQEGQILYLDLSEADSVVIYEQAAKPLEGLDGLLVGAGEILGSVVEYFQ